MNHNLYLYYAMLLVLGVATLNVLIGGITLLIGIAGVTLVGLKTTLAFVAAWILILTLTARWFAEAA